MNKFFRCSVLALLFLFSFSLQAEEKKDLSPIGIWLVGDKEAKVELYQNGEYLEGKIVWLKEPNEADGKPKVDVKNSDKKLATRPVMNMVFLTGFKKEKGENKWVDGSVYDAKTGNNYHGWIKMIDEKNIKLRGYVGISLFGRTDEWTKSEAP
jgi:uncharacterized protein (DUF2147 family)